MLRVRVSPWATYSFDSILLVVVRQKSELEMRMVGNKFWRAENSRPS